MFYSFFHGTVKKTTLSRVGNAELVHTFIHPLENAVFATISEYEPLVHTNSYNSYIQRKE